MEVIKKRKEPILHFLVKMPPSESEAEKVCFLSFNGENKYVVLAGHKLSVGI